MEPKKRQRFLRLPASEKMIGKHFISGKDMVYLKPSLYMNDLAMGCDRMHIQTVRKTMVKTVGSKQRDVKNANHRLILAQLRQHDVLSRSELVRLLSLSAPSISKNVDDLIARNVLIETGTVATNVGRRPNMLEINRQYGCVAAVDFSSTDIRVAIANMKAEMIDYGTVPGENNLGMAHLEQTIGLIRDMLERHRMTDRLLAISIGTPGDIDRQTGYFLYAPRFADCTKLNLRAIFQKAFDVDVLVKNDVNLATMGENMFGAGTNCQNMLYVAIDYGIGSGMILNGRLFEGARGFSGEIGLWLMEPEEAYRRYRENTLSEQVALDSVVSCFAIRQNIRHQLAAGRHSLLLNWADKDDDVTLEQILDVFRLRDKLCMEVVEEAAVKFACALKNLIDVLDVEVVIFGGMVRRFGDYYLDIVKDFLSRVQPTFPPRLIWSKLGDESTLYGAIGDALEYVFDQIVVQSDQ